MMLCAFILISLVGVIFAQTCRCPGRIGGGGTGNYNLVGITPRACNLKTMVSPTATCLPYQRNADGYCNSQLFPVDGITNTPQFSYVSTHDSSKMPPNNLKSARVISNIVGHQAEPIPNSNGLTDFVTFMAQFLDHMITSTVESGEDSEEFPVSIDAKDPIVCNFTRKSIPFRRSVRGCVLENTALARPINALSSTIDLIGVYGSTEDVVNQLRLKKDGLLKSKIKKKKEYLPRFSATFNKVDIMIPAFSNKADFFVAGDHRVNENPVLASLHILFLREHNRIARELKPLITPADIKNDPQFKGNIDEALFQLAKRVNEAQFQRVIVEEFFLAMTGGAISIEQGHIQSKRLAQKRLSVSDLFSTCAFRVGHTMVNEEVHIRSTKKLKLKKKIPLAELFFKPAKKLEKLKIEKIIGGAVMNRAQEIDTMVVDALRNNLFINVAGNQQSVDLLSLNLQRGRDHGIMSFNEVRKLVNLPPITSFFDISYNPTVYKKLKMAYNSVDELESWVGLMAEDHAPGSPMGPTLKRVWVTEFERLLGPDRFFYRYNVFHPLLKLKYSKQLAAAITGSRRMRNIILDNTDISASRLPMNIWKQ